MNESVDTILQLATYGALVLGSGLVASVAVSNVGSTLVGAHLYFKDRQKYNSGELDTEPQFRDYAFWYVNKKTDE